MGLHPLTAIAQYPTEIIVLTTLLFWAVPVFSLTACLALWRFSLGLNPKKLRASVNKRHCIVIGASKGLGKEVAILLAEAGADLTLIARGASKAATCDLTLARDECRKRQLSSDQKIDSIRTDVTDLKGLTEAFRSAVQDKGPAAWIVSAVGSAQPGFIASQCPQEGGTGSAEKMMELNYLSAVNVTRAMITTLPIDQADSDTKALQYMAPSGSLCGLSQAQVEKLPSHLVFVGSMLSLMSFIGYTAYASSKYALRGFTDGLRSEFLPLGVRVQLYIPGNMDTPGFEEENRIKPDITREIEGQAALLKPDEAARILLAGVLQNKYCITNDVLGEMARICVNGATPRAYLVLETFATPILNIIFCLWAKVCDIQIRMKFDQEAKKHDSIMIAKSSGRSDSKDKAM